MKPTGVKDFGPLTSRRAMFVHLEERTFFPLLNKEGTSLQGGFLN